MSNALVDFKIYWSLLFLIKCFTIDNSVSSWSIQSMFHEMFCLKADNLDIDFKYRKGYLYMSSGEIHFTWFHVCTCVHFFSSVTSFFRIPIDFIWIIHEQKYFKPSYQPKWFIWHLKRGIRFIKWSISYLPQHENSFNIQISF